MKRWLTFIFLLLCASANAATYYVDNVAGSDSNAGTSTGSPFKHSPGDAAASGNVPSSLNPGDVVLFHGGVTYGFTAGSAGIDIAWSGSAGNPIIYRSGDQATPQWGAAPAFIDETQATASVCGLAFGSGIGNLIIDGFIGANQTTVDNYHACFGSDGHTFGNNITVCHCIATNSGGDGFYFQGLFGAGSNPTGLTLQSNVCHDVNAHGSLFRGGMGTVLCASNQIWNTGSNIFGASIGGDDLAFFTFDTTAPRDIMASVIISNNLLGSSISKSSIIYSVSGSGFQTVNNILYGTNVVSDFDCNGSLTNFIWANNLITNCVLTFEGIWRFAPDSSYPFAQDHGLKILNNTGVCRPSLAGNGALIYCINGGQTAPILFYGLDVANNIFSQSTVPMFQVNTNTASPVSYVVDLATFTCDTNVYNGDTQFFTGGTGEAGNGGKLLTFSQWQSTFGQDTHSTTSVPSFVSPSTLNYQLAANDTVAASTGANLIATIQGDILGVGRPVTGPWSIGAYQFAGNPTVSGLSISAGGQMNISAGGQINIP